jgi:adenylate kinase
MPKTILIFFGPPGSGKGTQASLLAAKLKLPIIATGDLLRDEIARRTVIGGKVEKFLTKGALVPESVIYKIIDKRLNKKDISRGFILDGFPRNKKQLSYIIGKIKKIADSKSNVWTILVNVSDKEVLKRLSGRRVCNCGATYHLKYNPPKNKNVCDACGGKLYIRNDDRSVVIKKRLKLFYKEARSVLNYWAREKKLVTINGEQSIKKIHMDIIKKVRDKLANFR